MKKEGCIFCMLANGDLPTNEIYEDDKFKVILDLKPATRGHALVIPKDHYANIYEIPEDLAGEAMKLAKKLACVMTERLRCDGFNLVQNNGEYAGQTVLHFHIHLIPRYENDDQHLLWKPTLPTEDELKQIKELLRTN